MGCGPSKIDQEETAARCKDRKRFIRESVVARNGLAAAHSAYAVSLKNTSAALSEFAEGEPVISDIQRAHNNLAITSSIRRVVANTPADKIYPPPPPVPGEGSETLAPLQMLSSAALVEVAKNKGKAPMNALITEEEDVRDYGNVDEAVPGPVYSPLPPPPPPRPPPKMKGKAVTLLYVLNLLDADFEGFCQCPQCFKESRGCAYALSFQLC